MDSNNRLFWEEFIELYRENRCLWDVKSKEYTNKVCRSRSYYVLLNKLRETIPGATLELIKKKINNIRTSFRRELKKVQDSKVAGTVAGGVYEPTLWYYSLLSFIAQSEAERKEKSDDDDDCSADLVDTNDLSFSDVHIKEEELMLEPRSPDDFAESSTVPQEDDSEAGYCAPPSSTFSNATLSRKRKNVTNKFNPVKQKKFAFFNSAQRLSEDDEFLITGKKYAFQLKRMTDCRQRLIAEKLISDVMFYGGMGKLSEDAAIQLPSRLAQGSSFNNADDM